MGDAVNLASRLEGVTKQYGVGIIIGEGTRELLKDQFLLREIDCIRVKGRNEPLRIYEPLALTEKATASQQQHCAAWHIFLEHYRQQRWAAAGTQLTLLAEKLPPGLLQLYQRRLEHHRATPPPANWDGVTDLTEK